MNWIRDRLIEYYGNAGHNYIPALNEFRCSGLTVCDRKMYYSKIYPQEVSDYTKGIFTVGHILHEAIQNLVKDEFDSEVPVRYNADDIILVGHADLVSDDKVIDIKTSSRLPKEPYTAHHLQVNTYASILNKKYYGILYVEKNTLQVRYFEFITQKVLFDAVLDKCRRVYNCINNRQLPINSPSPLCKYCPYAEKCNNSEL